MARHLSVRLMTNGEIRVAATGPLSPEEVNNETFIRGYTEDEAFQLALDLLSAIHERRLRD
jgi:hypothetical protein